MVSGYGFLVLKADYFIFLKGGSVIMNRNYNPSEDYKVFRTQLGEGDLEGANRTISRLVAGEKCPYYSIMAHWDLNDVVNPDPSENQYSCSIN